MLVPMYVLVCGGAGWIIWKYLCLRPIWCDGGRGVCILGQGFMGKRIELSGPEISCDLSIVRYNAFIGCTLSVVRESGGDMFGVGVCVVTLGTGIFANTVPYRTLAVLYGILPVAHLTVRVYLRLLVRCGYCTGC